MIWVGTILVVIAGLAGAPLFAVVMAAAMLGFLSADIDLAIVAIEVYRIVDTPLLMVLPLFTYSGYLLAEAKTSERLVDLVQSMFGWLPSGLAMVGFLACAAFTALTGASGVTIVALGALLLPALVQSGYTEKYALGLVTTSGSLGLLLVPSVPLILYGIVAQQLDVGEPFTIFELFAAGVLPMLLMLTLLIVWTLWRHRGGKIPRVAFSRKRLWAALKAARWELPLPIILWNNSSLKQIRDDMLRRSIPTLGVNGPNPDFIALAKACNGNGVRVESRAEFTTALEQAWTTPTFTLIEVREGDAWLVD